MNCQALFLPKYEKKNVNAWSAAVMNDPLSYDVTSGSEITPCNKIDKPLVVYGFTGNVMMSIKCCLHNGKIITFLRHKSDFKVYVI